MSREPTFSPAWMADDSSSHSSGVQDVSGHQRTDSDGLGPS